jgi:hypothetical protein
MSSRHAVIVAAAVILWRGVSLGAFELNPADPRTLSLRHACQGFGGGPWACFGNPAGLALSRSTEAGFFYMPGLFGAGELACYGAGLTFPTGEVGMGLMSSVFGFALYKEEVFGFTAAYGVSNGFNAGARCRANRLAIAGYGASTTLTLDVGIQVQCSEEIGIGGTCTNVTSTELGKTGELLPQELSAGICYNPSPYASIFVSAGKELLSSLELCLGVEVKVADPLTLRLGISAGQPALISGGCGVNIAGVTFDYAYVYHWVLGATHEIGVRVAF